MENQESKKTKKSSKKLIGLFAGIGGVLAIAAVVLVIVLTGGHRVIKIKSVQGMVDLERKEKAMEIIPDMNLKSEDVLTTGADGMVELLIDTDKLVLAQPDTRFSIQASGSEKRGKLHIKLEYGAALTKIDNKLSKGSTFEIETPNASMSVRGTTFSTSYYPQENRTVVITKDGVVEVCVGDTTVQVNAGEMAIVEDDTVVVEQLPFAYTGQTLFEVAILTTGQGSNVHVKELVEWNHLVSTVQDKRVDELAKGNLCIRYWVQTEEEILSNIEKLDEGGFVMGNGQMVNQDGDLIGWTMTGQDGKPFSYRYYKPVTPGYYLHINVYVPDATTFEPGDTLEKFLVLTNDCYYVISDEIEYKEENTETQAETDVPGTIVTKEEIPALLAGDINYEELEFMIRVADTIRMHPGYSLAWQALDIMRYEPSLAGVYEPISGTSLSYDAEHLNGMFPAFTVKRIEQGDLPQYAKLENGVVTLQPATEPRKFVNTTQITSMYIDGEDNLWIEYTFDDKTEKVTGTAACVMTRNEEGKYHLNYLMEYERQAY